MTRHVARLCVWMALSAGCSVNQEPNGNGDGVGDDSNRQGEDQDSAACRVVDLVFSVDNSGSMTEEKQALRQDDVFGDFARALAQVGGGLEDYRVGVLDSCPDPAELHTRGEAAHGDPIECHFSSDQPWMTSGPELPTEFACAGSIYTDFADPNTYRCSDDDDTDERPAQAVAAAVEQSGKDGLNQGFLRNDALLVLVAMTDEDENMLVTDANGKLLMDGGDPVETSPREVYNRLANLKGGQAQRMVFVGIAGKDGCEEGEGAFGKAKSAQRLQEITEYFNDPALGNESGRGIFWDLCAGDLASALTQALDVIERACGELPDQPELPPGPFVF